MRLTYVLHIVAGGLALLSGYVALYAAKGGALHRRSGMVFVIAILVMCVAGTMMAVIRGVAPAVNIPAALLTSYLAITSLTTVRPLPAGRDWIDAGLMLVALGTGLASLAFARDALTSPDGMRQGMPAFPFLLFGTVALLAAGLDLRMVRSGGLTGAARITRHLWRMTFALFIAAMSFFIGQAKVFPEPMRIPLLLGMPVIAVLVTMLYWLWRVSIRRRLRGLSLVSTRQR
ncbi:MAG: hypothetical protein ACSLFK_15080 [Gemmatimonadaceae bacterium]